jgi:hypothetical protein
MALHEQGDFNVFKPPAPFSMSLSTAEQRFVKSLFS